MPYPQRRVSDELAALIQEVQPHPERLHNARSRQRAQALEAEITSLYQALLDEGAVALNDEQLAAVAAGRLDATGMLMVLVTAVSLSASDAGALIGAVAGGMVISEAALPVLARQQVEQQTSSEPAWMAPALEIIKEFEGLVLEAYIDAVGVVTIGWGTTHYSNGQPVKTGDRVTTEQAETLLREQVLREYAPGMFRALPMAHTFSPQQQAALISFTYNVGIEALQQSTLRKQLLAGADPAAVIQQQLPRWRFGDQGEALAGLERRRAAEVRLFLS